MCVTTKSALAAELGITKGRVSQYVAAGMPVRSDGKLDRGAAIRWVAKHHFRRFGGDAGAQRARELVRQGYADERPFVRDRWEPTDEDLVSLGLTRDEWDRCVGGEDVQF